MIFLTGGGVSAARAAGEYIGLMIQPGNGLHGQIPYFFCYGVDTGCFADAKFVLEEYLAYLTALPEKEKCLFATAPDVLGDPEATWRRSEPVLEEIRARGLRAALVAQDGLENPDWDRFDCLFVGGTDNWKLTEPAYQLAREAKERGKWTHLGRVNSAKRYLAAKASSYYDSADGNYIGFGPDVNLPKLERWLAAGKAQPSLWEI